jgi:single-strand DNA-binding protein
MNGLNKVIIMGTVGQDAEVKTIDGQNGQSTVARISIAVNDSYTDKSGQRQQTTEWFRVEAWNGLANFLSNYGKAGTNFLVEGKLKNETWENKEGVTQRSTKVVADRILFTGGKSNNNNQSQPQQQQSMQQAPQQPMQQAPQQPMQQAPQQSVPQQTQEQVNTYVNSDQFVNGMNNGGGDDLPF